MGRWVESDRVKRNVKSGCQQGYIIGVLINFNEDEQDDFRRSIIFFKNGEWAESIPPSLHRLWAAITLLTDGDAVEIRPCRPYSISPAKLAEAKQELDASRSAVRALHITRSPSIFSMPQSKIKNTRSVMST
ncbi:hypothetical protein QOT17_007182 [Balamuthia mandrillaris]